MAPSLWFTTKVLPGKRIEVTSPDFVEGEEVEVLVFLRERNRRSALDVLKSAPTPDGFKSADEVDEYIRKERDSWDR